ncbi:hypothetical protein Q604_UNBC10790G0001, partial [human gut metagenome]
GVLAGSTVGAAGAAASVVANFRSPPEKMQTLTPDQKHTISGTDDKTQRGLKREVQDQQAYLKQIDEEIKTTTKDTTLD